MASLVIVPSVAVAHLTPVEDFSALVSSVVEIMSLMLVLWLLFFWGFEGSLWRGWMGVDWWGLQPTKRENEIMPSSRTICRIIFRLKLVSKFAFCTISPRTNFRGCRSHIWRGDLRFCISLKSTVLWNDGPFLVHLWIKDLVNSRKNHRQVV